jgi:hypothetical protein
MHAQACGVTEPVVDQQRALVRGVWHCWQRLQHGCVGVQQVYHCACCHTAPHRGVAAHIWVRGVDARVQFSPAGCRCCTRGRQLLLCAGRVSRWAQWECVFVVVWCSCVASGCTQVGVPSAACLGSLCIGVSAAGVSAVGGGFSSTAGVSDGHYSVMHGLFSNTLASMWRYVGCVQLRKGCLHLDVVGSRGCALGAAW